MINVISTINPDSTAVLYDCFYNRETSQFYYNYRDTGKLPTPARLEKYGLELTGETFTNSKGATCYYVSGNWMPATAAKVGRKGSAAAVVSAANLAQTWAKNFAHDAAVIAAAVAIGILENADAAAAAAADAAAAKTAADAAAKTAADAAAAAAADAAAVVDAITAADEKTAAAAAKTAAKTAAAAAAAKTAADAAAKTAADAAAAAAAVVTDAIAAVTDANAAEFMRALLDAAAADAAAHAAE